MTTKKTTPHNWNRLAKKTGYNTVEITLQDGTPNGSIQWNYMRGQGCDCWLVTRHDNDDNQVGEGNYTAIRRSELPDVLKEMGTQTILDLDPDHRSGWENQQQQQLSVSGFFAANPDIADAVRETFGN